LVANAISFIHSRYDSLTPSEKRLAKYILQDPSVILPMTVSELSSVTGVSEATVVRFVRGVGFNTFQDFKLSLAIENVTTEKNDDQDITLFSKDSAEDILRKVKIGCTRTIESTASIVNPQNLVNAADFIRSAKRIEIFGVGSSAAVGKIFQYKLTRVGYPSFSIEDPHMQSISAATMTTGDLVVGISLSGSTKDTVDAVCVAKEHGANVICITDHIKSPITKYADVVLETYSRENPIKNVAGRSILAQIYLVEVLTGLLYSTDTQYVQKAGKETAKAVVNKLY